MQGGPGELKMAARSRKAQERMALARTKKEAKANKENIAPYTVPVPPKLPAHLATAPNNLPGATAIAAPPPLPLPPALNLAHQLNLLRLQAFHFYNRHHFYQLFTNPLPPPINPFLAALNPFHYVNVDSLRARQSASLAVARNADATISGVVYDAPQGLHQRKNSL